MRWGEGVENQVTCSPLGLLPTHFEEEKLPVPPLGWPSPVRQYLMPPHAPYLWRGATGSSQRVPTCSRRPSCQGPDLVSTPSPFRGHQTHLSSHFQLRSCAPRKSGHHLAAPRQVAPFLCPSQRGLPSSLQAPWGRGRDTFWGHNWTSRF